ncbi:hypothetical protein GE09DRAFT_1195094 [Coniochaeta sp. 2T2.1]|nr:hypothetical protein GE09DRAFT_1195094 [Coniochaeta sp. 2T2.1]
MVPTPFILALLSSLVTSVPVLVKPMANPLDPKPRIQYLGLTTSNLPRIYRDGGGGGRINGKDFLIFSDGIYTSDGRVPADNGLGNWANFSSNSIACSNCHGKGITSLQDFRTQQKGPKQQIPFFYASVEDDQKTAVWPDQGIATLCGGSCGVSFPVVVNRTEIGAGRNGDLYNTGIQITVTNKEPIVKRPTQGLFSRGELLFGSFGTLVGIDSVVYLSYTTDLSTGWSTPAAIYTLPPVTSEYNYAFHAYSNYDSTGKVIPISWTQYSTTDSYQIAMANVTFA